MKTSIFKTVIAAGLAFSPSLIVAQTPTQPAQTGVQAGRGETAGQARPPANAGTENKAANRDANGNPLNRETTNAANRDNTSTPNSQPAAGRESTPTSRDNGMSRTGQKDPAKQESFGQFDANKNGSLDPEEFTRFSMATSNSARDLSGTSPGGRGDAAASTPRSTTEADLKNSSKEHFRQLDANKDGMVSQEEFAGASIVNPEARPSATPTPDTSKGAAKSADENNRPQR